MSFFDTGTTPATEDDLGTGSRGERAGGRVVLAVLVLLVLLVGGGWVLAWSAAGENVPRGTSVADVAIGGRTRAEASAALERGLADRVAAPVTLTMGERSFTVDPAEAGLSVDREASVAAAGGGRSWDPRRLWDYYTGGDDLDPVVQVDEDALQAALVDLAAEAGQPARDGAVRLGVDGPQVVEPRTGTTLEATATRDALLAAYLAPDATAEITPVPVLPAIDASDVRRVMDRFVNPALSGPVTLVLDGTEVRLSPDRYVRALSVVAEDDRLVPAVDRERLAAMVERSVGEPVRPPRDATFRVVGGVPEVVPARAGRSYPPARLADALLEAAVAPDEERSVSVRGRREAADLTTREARRLGVREEVSHFSTYYPDAEYRNVNLGRAAELVDGTLLEPGDTFSLNDIVGERTVANGFTEGYVIDDGILVEDLGGGVSQLATTLFNAMYFAGLEDVEHKPHSFYIDRYPVGREATVAFGVLDLRFRNDTDHGVLVSATVTPSSGATQGEVDVRMYSTKTWDIESRTSGRYDYTSPTTRVLDTPDCYAYTGSGGFTVVNHRDFRRPGKDRVVRTERFRTVYTPSDSVVCRS